MAGNLLRIARDIYHKRGLVELTRRTCYYGLEKVSNIGVNISDIYHRKFYSSGCEDQKELIHNLIQRDEFVLIILDACRYDYFKNIHSDYIEGELKPVWSRGNKTPRWASNTWTGQYDLTYVSGAPWLSDFRYESQGIDYRPTDHIDEIIPVWLNNWDHNRFTTNPRSITNYVLSSLKNDDNKRIVVHYLQPHGPYIGKEDGTYSKKPVIPLWRKDSIEPNEQDLERTHPSKRKNEGLPYQRYFIDDQIKEGDLTLNELRNAYSDNIKTVLNEVQHLLSHIDQDCKTVITADHGQFLGERTLFSVRRRYKHEDWTHPILRKVPWFEVPSSELLGQDIEEQDYSQTNRDEDELNEVRNDRLKQLGYL